LLRFPDWGIPRLGSNPGPNGVGMLLACGRWGGVYPGGVGEGFPSGSRVGSRAMLLAVILIL
jgi:hypothetical protein